MTATAICTEGLTKRYGHVDVLSNLNLEVPVGEVLGYLGPNGAGKTTTIRLLLGLIRPTSGHSSIFGLDSQRQAVEAHRRLAYENQHARCARLPPVLSKSWAAWCSAAPPPAPSFRGSQRDADSRECAMPDESGTRRHS